MTMLRTEEAVCPLDGTRYDYTAVLSFSTFGCELDGLPMSMTVMPHRIPTCPACRFPNWIRDLSDAEVATARQVVASDAFLSMSDEAPYAQLAYLQDALGRATPERTASWLLSACWQTPPGSGRYLDYARRLAEAAQRAEGAIRARGRDEWPTFQTFIANVERQAGLWDEAEARLDGLDPALVEDARLGGRVMRTRELIHARDSKRHTFNEGSWD